MMYQRVARVALRKESVDRNHAPKYHRILLRRVALRKESVDRNWWVEGDRFFYYVALRKESVDRNYKERPGQKARPKSLSARRAWIEIPPRVIREPTTTRRSPQGERG